MNTRTKRSNNPALPKVLATAGITLLLMTPLTASADHERHDIVEVLAGAAVAYLIIDALDDNDRYYRRHTDHYAHDRHYKRHHHDRYCKPRHHAKHKREHRQHRRYERHGYKDRAYRRHYR
jgi:hypothetical protein